MMLYPPKYLCYFTQLFQKNIFVFLKVTAAQLESMVIMFHCHICILPISSFPIIYIYIVKYGGNVWEGELTVSHSELDICHIVQALPRDRDAQEGLERPGKAM